MNTLHIGVIQCAMSDDIDDNVSRVSALIEASAAQGAQVILPPELFENRYFPQTKDPSHHALAKPLAGHPTIEKMSMLAKRLNVVIPVSFFERDGERLFNSVAMVDAGGRVLGRYRKSHIPDGPGYEEKFYFEPGDTGFLVWDTRFGRIGVGICWDQWFVEAARSMALMGASVLLYPSAIGSEPEHPSMDSLAPWRRVMTGHAVANASVVAAANRVGVEGDLTFYGSSFVVDARGETLAELSRDTEGTAVATIDLDALAAYRKEWNLFKDRRPELYGSLTDTDHG